MKKCALWLKKYSSWILLFIYPAINFYLLEWYTHNPFKTMKTVPQVLNLVLFELLTLFLFALFNRLNAALMTLSVFCMIYGLAGYFVLEFRGAPIQPWDILSLSTAASVADNYEYKLDRTALTVLIGFVILLLLEFFCRARIGGKRREDDTAAGGNKNSSGFAATAGKRSGAVRPWQKRLALGFLSALLLFGYTKMLHNEEFVQTKLRLYDKLFTPTTIQFKNGTLTAFLMELQYISVDKPSGYSKSRALELLASHEEQAGAEYDAAGKKPNIIVIMNEAFSDPSVLGEFTANEDYMPFVRGLMDGAPDTVSGWLSVSVKGGNTANTEFEYLTGNTMAFLPYGSIPYQQYMKGERMSMASHLSSLGYHTAAMHPYRAGGWDRDTVYPDMGFEEIHFEEFFRDSEIIRKYVSDRGNYEKIIQVYENKPEDQPLFLFNVTMQNHSSYSDWNDYDNFKPDITVDNSSSKLLPAYLSLMKLSDEAIEELVHYFEEQPEETVIVFFGDHQPTDSVVNPVLQLTGRTCADLSAEEETLRYKVPFFIWANFDIQEQTGVETSANFLGAMTLEAAGLPLSGYFHYLSGLRQDVSVLSAGAMTLSDGTLTEPAEQKELLNDYRTMQYYLLFDYEPEK